MEGTTGQTRAGSASAERGAQLIFYICLENDLPEYAADKYRVAQAINDAIDNDNALRAALSYLAQGTRFQITIAATSSLILPVGHGA